MSRSGYTDDGDHWDMIRWRGAVTAAIKGRRGQAFLRELAAALDALPEKKLIADDLEREGQVCALGAIGRERGLPLSEIDPWDREKLAEAFGVAKALALEIEDVNDHVCRYHTLAGEHEDAARWRIVREWVAEQIGEKKV